MAIKPSDTVTELKLYYLPDETGPVSESDIQAMITSQLGTQNGGQQKLAAAYYQSANFKTGVQGWQLTAAGNLEANAGTFRGALVANSIDIPDTTTANSFHVNSAGDAWWGATTLGSAVASITKAGAGSFSSITITGGSISSTPISSIPNNSSTDISLLEFTHNLVFTSASATQINWASGTIVMSNGRTFAISSGNTGTMAAATYIYLDTGVSSTVLQTTTTYSTAMGANKILIGTAQNNTTAASVIPFGGGQPVLDGVGNIAALSITAASIAATTITAAKIAASTITGTQISTMNISGKSATFDTGTIAAFTMAATTLSATNLTLTSGAANTANIAVGTGSNLAGMNSGNSGSDIAFWSGATFANRATAPFRVDLAGNLTATSATLSGYTVATGGTFGGDGSDGALTLTSGTTTLSFASASVLVKNYTAVSITSTGKLAFSTPATNGSLFIMKSQAGVTITSSATCIDLSSMGATGGAATVNASANTAGTTGTPGSVIFIAANGGVGGSSNGTSPGAGGAVPSSVLYAGTFSQHMNRYPAITCGAGGGSGAANSSGATVSSSGVGGVGGGSLIVECAGAWNFTTASGISVAGGNGGNATYTSGSAAGVGGGGGGAAGMVFVLYKTLTANSGTVVTTGGTGGNGANAGGGQSEAGGGGGACITAGTIGTSPTSSGSKSGGDGASGTSSIAANSSFA